MYLLSRDAHEDFMEILNENKKMMTKGGVVYNFKGSVKELNEIL